MGLTVKWRMFPLLSPSRSARISAAVCECSSSTVAWCRAGVASVASARAKVGVVKALRRRAANRASIVGGDEGHLSPAGLSSAPD